MNNYELPLKPGKLGYESYALTLDENYRIRGFTYDCWSNEDAPRVSELPQGDIADYLYINNQYVYDPLPKQPTEIESLQEYINELKNTQSLLKQQVADVLERNELLENCILEMSEEIYA